MNGIPSLDVDWLRAFVSVAETRSFTAAGTALAAAQSTVSVRIRKLEERLRLRLMERNAREVALTPAGADFLDDARAILQKHDDAALRAMGARKMRSFELAVSDHAAGALLPLILATLRRERPETQLLVTVGISRELFRSFALGQFDAVIGREDELGADGRLILTDKLAWAAARDFRWTPGEALPLVALAAPCGVREIAVSALAASGIAWRSAFTGTGVAAIQAAASAGLGVTCLETRNIPADCRRLGARSGLPSLPETQIVMRTRHRSVGEDEMAATIAASVKAAMGGARRR
ncbi:MAG: LysR family transcriptional regulator [Alphaproteobacteria bacterium]|nr:LysR family transcriptional regulator [Alphaproteobacteria bacterium]